MHRFSLSDARSFVTCSRFRFCAPYDGDADDNNSAGGSLLSLSNVRIINIVSVSQVP